MLGFPRPAGLEPATYGLEGRGTMHGPCVAPGALLYDTLSVPEDNISGWSELLVSLHSLLVLRREEMDAYDNQYVRKFSGPVRVRFEESVEEVEIGQIEMWYIDGSRAADDGLDIVDVCDSLGQGEYECASAVYTSGSIDASIVDGPFSNDILVIHSLELQPGYQGQGLEARIVWKIGQTLGYHCAAVVFCPEQVGLSEKDELGQRPTKNPSFQCLTDF